MSRMGEYAEDRGIGLPDYRLDPVGREYECCRCGDLWEGSRFGGPGLDIEGEGWVCDGCLADEAAKEGEA